MQPLPTGSRRSTRLALVTAGLVVLLAVVAFASRSGFGHSSHSSPSNTYLSYAFTLFLILFVVMIPVTIWAWIVRAREEDATKRPSGWRRFVRNIAGLATGIAAAYVIYEAKIHLHLVRHTPTSKVAPIGKGHGHGGGHLRGPAGPQSPTFQWTVLWIVLALGAVGAIALFVGWRRWKQRAATAGPTPELTEVVAATISDAIEDLEREPDPRRAVIAAYARMERTLGRHGLPRRLSETAIEYMRRVLLGLSASGDAIGRLTSLFERAKFSHHEIDSSMKADAIEALREIREGMA